MCIFTDTSSVVVRTSFDSISNDEYEESDIAVSSSNVKKIIWTEHT